MFDEFESRIGVIFHKPKHGLLKFTYFYRCVFAVQGESRVMFFFIIRRIYLCIYSKDYILDSVTIF